MNYLISNYTLLSLNLLISTNCLIYTNSSVSMNSNKKNQIYLLVTVMSVKVLYWHRNDMEWKVYVYIHICIYTYIYIYIYIYIHISRITSLPKKTVGEGKLIPIGGNRNCRAICTSVVWNLCLFFGNERREVVNATEWFINKKMHVTKTSLKDIDDDPAITYALQDISDWVV
jgi:hypothetical protein